MMHYFSLVCVLFLAISSLESRHRPAGFKVKQAVPDPEGAAPAQPTQPPPPENPTQAPSGNQPPAADDPPPTAAPPAGVAPPPAPAPPPVPCTTEADCVSAPGMPYCAAGFCAAAPAKKKKKAKKLRKVTKKFSDKMDKNSDADEDDKDVSSAVGEQNKPAQTNFEQQNQMQPNAPGNSQPTASPQDQQTPQGGTPAPNSGTAPTAAATPAGSQISCKTSQDCQNSSMQYCVNGFCSATQGKKNLGGKSKKGKKKNKKS